MIWSFIRYYSMGWDCVHTRACVYSSMYVCMCAFVRMCVCLRLFAGKCKCLRASACVCTRVPAFHASISVCTRLPAFAHGCVHLRTYVHVFVRIYEDLQACVRARLVGVHACTHSCIQYFTVWKSRTSLQSRVVSQVVHPTPVFFLFFCH